MVMGVRVRDMSQDSLLAAPGVVVQRKRARCNDPIGEGIFGPLSGTQARSKASAAFSEQFLNERGFNDHMSSSEDRDQAEVIVSRLGENLSDGDEIVPDFRRGLLVDSLAAHLDQRFEGASVLSERHPRN
jgi:hypothetical protein